MEGKTTTLSCYIYIMKRKKFTVSEDCIQPEFDFDFSMDTDADSKTKETIENVFLPDELPVNQTDDGYRNWKKETEEKIRQISALWGIPLFKNVRIKLSTHPKEYNGRLILLVQPTSMDRRTPLSLRLNFSGKDFEFGFGDFVEFLSSDIEYVKRIV